MVGNRRLRQKIVVSSDVIFDSRLLYGEQLRSILQLLDFLLPIIDDPQVTKAIGGSVRFRRPGLDGSRGRSRRF
jgi:hypothetical protein